MSVNLKTETIIDALRQVPSLLGPGRNGRPRHKSFIIRAIKKGLNGRRLEALRVGSSWITSVEAVQRWLVAQTDGLVAETARSTTDRGKSEEQAHRELGRLGF